MIPSQIRALFSGLSAELAAMMETVEGLSEIIAEHAWQTPGDRRSGVLIKAQGVDDLHQTLDALHALAGALSSGVPVENAVAGIPLSALADRLRSASSRAAPGPEAATRPGDLILFD